MRKDVLVFTGRMAKELLRRGYTIIDVKPHNNLVNATVFVFKNEGSIMNEIRLLKKNDQ